MAAGSIGGEGAGDIAGAVRRVRNRDQLLAFLLVLPALLFLIAVFVVPLVLFTLRSVDNGEAWQALPATRAALAGWDGRSLPDEPAFAALAADIRGLDRPTAAQLGRRLNYSRTGFRSLIIGLHDLRLDPSAPVAPQLQAADPRWGEVATWQTIARESGRLTGYYMLTALDLEIADGALRARSGDGAVFREVFGRTFWISGVVTLLCALLGFPVAYVLASSRGWGGRLLLAAVLLPFWTSVLVRTTSWILLLQQNGILNRFLIDHGLIGEPLTLIYNRAGVYIAMTHVLLPFFVLPLYGVMTKVDRAQLRAAASLGARPVEVFRLAYLPQVMPGIVAGAVLVFVTAVGYYITPVLVGGGGDQMVSYFVAFYTNVSVNWGMAAAVGTLLLASVLLLLALFQRFLAVLQPTVGR